MIYREERESLNLYDRTRAECTRLVIPSPLARTRVFASINAGVTRVTRDSGCGASAVEGEI